MEAAKIQGTYRVRKALVKWSRNWVVPAPVVRLAVQVFVPNEDGISKEEGARRSVLLSRKKVRGVMSGVREDGISILGPLGVWTTTSG